MAVKPLGKEVLTEEALRKDKKTIQKFDQCGLGEKAIYFPSRMHPRSRYVPYSAVTHVYRRVAVSPGSGKLFLTPILYLVVRYDDGQEAQCSFRYIKEADQMMDALEKAHPEISLLSPDGEKKKAEKEAREEARRNTELPEKVSLEKQRLERARWQLHKQPPLTDRLAGVARVKRSVDLINPVYQWIALGVMLAGAALIIAAIVLIRQHGSGSLIALLLIGGFAAMFMMVNSKVLPTRKRNRKNLQKDYDAALAAMEKYIAKVEKESGESFPLPARYAHPTVADRCIRILEERRADTADEALEVLKEELRAADSSVALSGDDYKEVVLIKPLFLVADYR